MHCHHISIGKSCKVEFLSTGLIRPKMSSIFLVCSCLPTRANGGRQSTVGQDNTTIFRKFKSFDFYIFSDFSQKLVKIVKISKNLISGKVYYIFAPVWIAKKIFWFQYSRDFPLKCESAVKILFPIRWLFLTAIQFRSFGDDYQIFRTST